MLLLVAYKFIQNIHSSVVILNEFGEDSYPGLFSFPRGVVYGLFVNLYDVSLVTGDILGRKYGMKRHKAVNNLPNPTFVVSFVSSVIWCVQE